MSWLRKISGRGGGKSAPHTYLCQRPHWRVVGVRVFEPFFRTLSDLVPEESVLYIECDCLMQDVEEYLKGLAIQDSTPIKGGTIWPKSKSSRIPITHANMVGLAQISQRHAEPEVATHMVVYRGSEILLEWYDAGLDPIYVSRAIDESNVRTFCAHLGATYDDLI